MTYLGLTTLFLTCLLSNVFIHAYDLNFYCNEYTTYDLGGYTGLNANDYHDGMEVLLDYLQDKRDDIDIDVTVFDQVQPLFNQREIDHMVDVKILAHHAFTLMVFSGLTTLVIVAVLLKHIQQYIVVYPRAFKTFHYLLIGSLIGLIIFITADFNTFWTTFHHIFFAGNDLWILDPSTDVMIRMLPSELFMDLVIRILISFILSYGCIHGLILWFNHRYIKEVKS